MIDKLDLRAPPNARFRPEILDFLGGFSLGPYKIHARPSSLYAGKADLRELGIDAKLYVGCRFGNKGHKLEILDVGDKHYSEIVQIIESVFDGNPDELGILRTDFNADVEDVPVSWFQGHAVFLYKQLGSEYGKGKYHYVGRDEIETVDAGKRPNMIRIYDKISEWAVQLRRMQRKQRKQSIDSNLLTFEKQFGYPLDSIVTRVERQIGGRVPEQIATFGSLIRNAVDFDPFSAIRFIDGSSPRLPTVAECPGVARYTGLGLHAELSRLGMQKFRKQLNKACSGNAARILERYAAFLPKSERTFTLAELHEVYRQSTTEQLAA